MRGCREQWKLVGTAAWNGLLVVLLWVRRLVGVDRRVGGGRKWCVANVVLRWTRATWLLL